MNITEANAVQTIVRWLVDPEADETEPGAEDRARDALATLADRSSATLGAGLRREDVESRWQLFDVRPVETVHVPADGPL